MEGGEYLRSHSDFKELARIGDVDLEYSSQDEIYGRV
jgi:hypothetical protein